MSHYKITWMIWSQVHMGLSSDSGVKSASLCFLCNFLYNYNYLTVERTINEGGEVKYTVAFSTRTWYLLSFTYEYLYFKEASV